MTPKHGTYFGKNQDSGRVVRLSENVALKLDHCTQDNMSNKFGQSETLEFFGRHCRFFKLDTFLQ